MSITRNFLGLLFDPGELTCYTQRPTGTAVKRHPHPQDEFFCINPLDAHSDFNPTEEWHAPNRPRRADHNVIAFRNFLIELDEMPIHEQIGYVKELVPVSAITFSGSKSYHFIISLKDPCASLQEYRNIAHRLLSLVSHADQACKNPSRLSRLAGHMRSDTQRLQSLIELNERIDKQTLIDLLPSFQERALERAPGGNGSFVNIEVHAARKSPDEFMSRKNIPGRNQFFFWLGQRLLDANTPFDSRMNFVLETYNNLVHKDNFTLQEALMAARLRGRSV